MILDHFRFDASSRSRMSATITFESEILPEGLRRSEEVWFEWPGSYFSPECANPDPFAIAAIPFALILGEDIHIRSPISQRLLLNLLDVIAVYRSYYPATTKDVQIFCTTESRSAHGSKRVGSFFSGGIDSLYNIAELRRLNELHGTPPVSDLWLVHGADIRLNDVALWQQTRDRLSAASKAFTFVDIATNLRELHGRFIPWPELGFSSVLGAIAKLFSEKCDLALIGSAWTFAHQIPHASTPLIDPLWSCDRQNVMHFTGRTSRLDKVRVIQSHAPEFLPGLRVCYKNPDGAYNCGVCEKCLRTQLELLCTNPSAGLEQFERHLSPEAISQIRLSRSPDTQYATFFWKDLARASRSAGMGEIAQAIDRMLLRHAFRYHTRQTRKLIARKLRTAAAALGLSRARG